VREFHVFVNSTKIIFWTKKKHGIVTIVGVARYNNGIIYHISIPKLKTATIMYPVLLNEKNNSKQRILIMLLCRNRSYRVHIIYNAY